MSVSITDAELTLMRLLWDQSPLTARDITQELKSEREWHRKTVNTLLSRLEKKGAVKVRKLDGGVKHYAPVIKQSAYAQKATSEFVDRLFDGDITPLVASFASTRRLDSEQIAELQGLLEELSDDD